MYRKKNKSGQMQISFGMIFSIILVIVFLAFAFYAIQKFLGMQEEIKMQLFKEDFQKDIDKMWASSQGPERVEYIVSSKIDSMCVFDDRRGINNFQIYRGEIVEQVKFEKIDVDKSLVNGSPLCITTENSRISFLLDKKYGENLVTIKK